MTQSWLRSISFTAWLFSLSVLLAWSLTACGALGRRESVATQSNDSATPVSDLTGAEPQVTGAVLALPLDTVENYHEIAWPAGKDGIVVAGDERIVLVQPSSSDPGAQADIPIESQAVDAAAPALLVAAQDAAVSAWVDNSNRVMTLDGTFALAAVQAAESASSITGLAVTADGERLAYSTSDGRLVVVPRSGEPAAQTDTGWEMPGWLTSLSFSPDEQWVGGVNPPTFTIYIVEAATGDVQRTLEWVESPVHALYSAIFSPNWNRVAWVAQTAVQVMTVADGKLGPLLNHEDHVSAAAWSPDGGRLSTAAVESLNGEPTPMMVVWDAENGRRLLARPSVNAIISLAFSPDGRQVAVLDSAGNLQVWDVVP